MNSICEMKSLATPCRTEGDGMENASATITESVRDRYALGKQLIYKPENIRESFSIPPVITGQIVNLSLKNVIPSKKDKSVLSNLKSKEPKFIPYEPYKAAVKPIIPYSKKGRDKHAKVKNDEDIKVLATQMLNAVKISELENKDHVSVNEDVVEDRCNCCLSKSLEAEQKIMREEIKTLKEENTQLESQLKFQAQVNAELKALLVASVGEDIETRMQLLTHDKLQLARALLNSAQHLSSHQEQTEWLAGQCEVWRSKFLASSLIVEELARWKAALCQRVLELQESMKRLLEERLKVRDGLLHSFRNFNVLRENFDVIHSMKSDLSSTNIMDLSLYHHKVSDVLKLQLLGSISVQPRREPDFSLLDRTTIAEKNAEALLSNPSTLLLSDSACNSAVVGAAVAMGGSHLLGISTGSLSCCAHCSGEVKVI